MRKQLVEEFSKDAGNFRIKLVAGIDPNPPDPYPNAIFYIRMEALDREMYKKVKVEPIWLSLNEMSKLSILMNIASRFWLERLEKTSWDSQKKIRMFIGEWDKISQALDDLFSE